MSIQELYLALQRQAALNRLARRYPRGLESGLIFDPAQCSTELLNRLAGYQP